MDINCFCCKHLATGKECWLRDQTQFVCAQVWMHANESTRFSCSICGAHTETGPQGLQELEKSLDCDRMKLCQQKPISVTRSLTKMELQCTGSHAHLQLFPHIGGGFLIFKCSCSQTVELPSYVFGHPYSWRFWQRLMKSWAAAQNHAGREESFDSVVMFDHLIPPEQHHTLSQPTSHQFKDLFNLFFLFSLHWEKLWAGLL